jgi:chaperone BCS1
LSGDDPWLLQQVETKVFQEARETIHNKTKLDIDWIVATCAAIHKGKTAIPDLGVSVLEYCKDQATSSIAINKDDSVRYNGILRLAAEKSSGESTSWLTWRGQHDQLDKDGTMSPIPGKADRFFWHDGTLFSIELPRSDDDYNGQIEYNNLIVRCFGGTHEPVQELIAYVEKQAILCEKLSVIRMTADAKDQRTEREKRHLDTIDLDPEMLKDIRMDAEDFFHEGTPKFCRDTGVPCRRGYLFHGPPGTGKTSLSVAIPSHVNVPLVTISLSGMDDNRLEQAFSSIPYRCVVLVEDIDCVGADLGRRSKPKASKSNDNSDRSHDDIDTEVANTFEQTMNQFLYRQEQSNQAILQAVNNVIQQQGNVRIEPVKAPKEPAPKKINLGALLNVIDGATAAEGRLLIMTTNHVENLDPALLRKGRVDRDFKIGYATKVTAELTFNRIFGQDTCRRHTVEAINRFARAFKDQYPVHSKITTATLAQYCGQYRGRPCQAVQDFGEYIRVGDDMFSCTIDQLADVPSSSINVPEAFNPALLKEGPEDFCRLDAAPDIANRGVLPKPAPSLWSPLSWVRASKADAPKKSQQPLSPQGEDSVPSRETVAKSKVNLATTNVQSAPVANIPPNPSLNRQAQIKAQCASLGLVPKSTTHQDGRTKAEIAEAFDFNDEVFGNFAELSLNNPIPFPAPVSHSPSSPPQASQRADQPIKKPTHGNTASSVRFSEPGKLRSVSPRPTDGDPPTSTGRSKAPSYQTSENGVARTKASEDSSTDSGFAFLSRITLDSRDFGARVRNGELEEGSEPAGGDLDEGSPSVSDSDGESVVFFDADE